MSETPGVSPQAMPTPAKETRPQREARMRWWREARFGMFVHWGLFSAAGGTWKGERTPWLGCWMQASLQIPKDHYGVELLPKFTGERFSAPFIAQMAVDAGMKYIVPITKHHEGFCLFDSAFTDFTIAHTPARRDWIRELADASRARGLKVGFYYSQNLDWHHTGEGWTPERYFDGLVLPQIGELLSAYGEISILWFDIPGGVIDADRANRLVELARRLQPSIVINNRLGGGFKGDFQTPEQDIPPAGIPGADWETCQTLNGTWEYTHYDRDWKSPTRIIRELIETASKGGNYLLNIGPKPDGTVPHSTMDTLRAIGGWMRVHGEAIHGTSASPFPRHLAWGRCTRKALAGGTTRLYLHIFHWPFDAILRVPALANEITAVSLLSDPGAGPLGFATEVNGDLRIQLPIAEPDDHATVVIIDLRGDPRPVIRPIAPGADGTLRLDAELAIIEAADALAEISGLGEKSGTLSYHPETRSLDIGANPADQAWWPILVASSEAYAVHVEYRCQAGDGGCSYLVELGGHRLRAMTSSTPDWTDFRVDRIGTVTLDSTARIEVIVCSLDRTGATSMHLRSVILTPEKEGETS